MKNLDTSVIVKEKEAEQDAQHVSFLIGEETYGVVALKVREIIGIIDITHVPDTVYFMEGVINLRGSVVPVVDMRKKFRMPVREYDSNTVIIIVEVDERLIGMVVDSVSDVLNIPVSSIQSTQHFKGDIGTEFIHGIGQVDDNMIILLDVDMILDAKELAGMDDETLKKLELKDAANKNDKKTAAAEDNETVPVEDKETTPIEEKETAAAEEKETTATREDKETAILDEKKDDNEKVNKK